jgi:LysR family glycine cleavage system transcriptional activator
LNGVYLLHCIFSFIVSGGCVVPICRSFSRSNDIDLGKRIIALASDVVHAVIRIGSLDFQKGISMKLPPMNSLRAFEAVSRLGSVSKAAEELCVSQGSVSQQLRKLEDHLDRELFIRTPNSFKLSAEGETYAAVVQRSLGEIAFASREVARTKTRRGLTISTGPSFAQRWLMPNLEKYYQSFPDVPVVIDKTLKLVTFKRDGIDAAIRFSDGEDGFDGLDNVLLFHPQIFAVASPAYIADHGMLESLTKPGKHHLIDGHYSLKEGGALHTKWQDVVSGNQIDPAVQYESFPDHDQTLNAAVQGRGIALLPSNLIEAEIESGKIEYAHPESIPARYKCYFVSPADARPNGDLIAFRDWLVDSLKEYRIKANNELADTKG